MTREPAIQTATPPVKRLRRRCGTTAIEVMVAFTLLTGMMAVSVPLVVRHGRLLVTARHYRLALDELSNQLDRLTALPESQLPEELSRLAPSPFAASRLPGAELSGELVPADVGRRITLRIVWDEPQRRAAPVSMAAWVMPKSERAARRPSGGPDR